MTLIFVFPIKNAWVIVSDKLQIGKDGTWDFDENAEVKERVNNITKMEYLPTKNLIFTGAGDSKLLQFFVEKIGLKDNLEEFIQDYPEICSSLKSGGDFEKSVEETEFIVVDQSNLNIFWFLNGQNRKIEEHHFVGNWKNLKNLNDVKSKLKRRKDYLFCKDDKDVILEWIYCLEDLSKQKLSSVGHPAIDGCDVWIIEKNKLFEIGVSPKLYNYEVKER